ncbi:hypothetical protein CXG81DRAFT_28751 [Caulochytrium protostelioides]|uniref:Pyruvate kinase n=1 Tax=Caulochytrium protostelioides TaxID=1555241 RepID=A0A4V1ITV9_9FUNG|nr:pyruvate kinase [Caulochytrium protostelioides]RKO98417.1 hypothetical protein CXG81DRAFT_28751 [Caulochytrium protostelioides]|eukprot:RKO98417.1 hypothetical protein CXG81DRAFT_28751 [Caulochytrium protostelioides]
MPSEVFRKHPAHFADPSPDILRTKIVCTIGPASCSKEMLTSLVKLGMNIARLNLSHCTHEFCDLVINNLREITAEEGNGMAGTEVAVWIDLNGPKVRSGRLRDGKPVFLNAGDEFLFVNDDVLGDQKQISTSYPGQLVNVGDRIYVDDGILSFEVLERLPTGVRTRVCNSGTLGENKGINFPQHSVDDLPAISAKDRTDLQYAIKAGVDFVSVSCIRNIEDVEEARLLLGNSRTKLLAKIENQHGLDNYASILKMAYGIVIDRGYLGAEVDVEVVTMAQKRMISEANLAGKPVMIANQMLESMRTNPRPARSEAADVANAVMDGVDGLILSGETAIGDFVLEAVTVARRVAYTAERNTNYLDHQTRIMRSIPKPVNVSESIASSAVLCARQVNAKVIVCITEVGGTARLVAKYRPMIPVVAATLDKQTARQLSLNFGLVPFHHEGNPDDVVDAALKYACSLGLCQSGDVAVITSGQVVGFLEGTTTKMQLVNVPEF